MAGTLTAFDLAQLPPPAAVEEIDFEAILASMLADLRARDPAFTSTVESDPAYKVLEATAYREVILRQRVNDAARRRLLAFAAGADLDQLAAFYGMQRLVVTQADPTASPPVVAVYETDSAFRVRVRERIMGSSAAGTASWYKFHALTASPHVRDVAVDAPLGGVVRVSVMGDTTDGAPSAEALQAVTDVVTSNDVRALCHTVQVVPAELATVDVVANIRLQPTASASLIAEIEAALLAAFEQARGLGWDVTTSWLVARLQVPGVHSVELVQPAVNVAVAPNQCAALGTVALNYTGRGA